MSLFGTVVFIGCGDGLNDPNFSALRAFMTRNPGRHRHFRLELDHRCADLRKEHAADGISVIGYGETHGHLAPFLHNLKTRPAAAGPGAGTSTNEAPALPPRPACCIGRDQEVEALVAVLLAGEPVAVLGPAGIGKSTACLQALHDPRVAERFGKRRHFVRLDGAATAKDMLAGIAPVLGLPVEQARIDAVVARLAASPAALALDNLETPWSAETLETEALLAELAAVPGASLAVTLRWGQQPGGVAWREPIEVRPLGTEDARRVFLAIAGNRHAADPRLGDLLTALDGVPLAIELLAYPAQAEPDLDGLWQRWQAGERTAMLRRGTGDHRLLNLAVSLELSIAGPGMTDPARRLLSLLGLLPDGIARDALETLLPGCGNAAAATLRQVALAFNEARRVRVLAPIREHLALHHPPAAEDLSRAVDHYAGLAADLGSKCGWEGGAQAIARLSAETANIEQMLLLGLQRPEPRIVEATIAFGEFQRLSGLGTAHPLDRAASVATSIDSLLAALALFKRALVASRRSDEDRARERFEAARSLYSSIGNDEGEASCLKGLGDLALKRSDYDSAMAWYNAAMPLYSRAGSVLGMANCIQRLAEIALKRGDLDSAEKDYKRALPLHRQEGSLLGEANSLKGLGDIALARSVHDEARHRFQSALSLYRRVGDVAGELYCIHRLGDIALAQGDTEGARKRFKEALELSSRIPEQGGDVDGLEAAEVAQYFIGWSHKRLMDIARDADERLRHRDAARQAWQSIGRDDLLHRLD
jgi:tetratricopeptide (TPR) repeat protein